MLNISSYQTHNFPNKRLVVPEMRLQTRTDSSQPPVVRLWPCGECGEENIRFGQFFLYSSFFPPPPVQLLNFLGKLLTILSIECPNVHYQKPLNTFNVDKTNSKIECTALVNKTCAFVQRLLEALKIDLQTKVGWVLKTSGNSQFGRHWNFSIWTKLSQLPLVKIEIFHFPSNRELPEFFKTHPTFVCRFIFRACTCL